ncbi:flagellar basal body P-ring protein FlgI [Vulcaniibacterium tengchongense]|uniref:Flagellar P-ring protein n=1 Tax=Vulcaniibacterium tengchongense TaxID=1273429 RepID=A0A3N4VE15_9GAMM|nr:flagellar basal body P-ring protein FlgI [Vulcaniibacterium tengchongense]RPE80878.1 flagellar P-ring protein precursor FlgI [Vulcaniibacterium tengchongense]
MGWTTKTIGGPRGWRRLALATLALWAFAPAVQAERIKDLAQVAGVRGNPLVGYGLVVGLDGSGDRTSQTPFTVQSLKTMLDRLGVSIPPGVNPQLKNVAAVAIHAELPPYAKPGQAIDVTVSSIGNAVSLRGGSLLMAPLRGADGQVYAVAQGSLVVSGFGAAGRDGSRISVNAPNGGRIPNGAIVERAVAGAAPAGNVTLNLHEADFTTAARIVEAIDRAFGAGRARAVDAVTIEVEPPADADRVGFLARLEALDVNPGAAPAKVIVNSRTGTVVMGGQVTVLPAAVSHGSLAVSITEDVQVSQPNPLAGGATVAAPRSTVEARQEGGRMFLLEGGTSLEAIVRAVNAVGAAPGDIVAILEALKRAGALRAELEVI